MLYNIQLSPKITSQGSHYFLENICLSLRKAPFMSYPSSVCLWCFLCDQGSTKALQAKLLKLLTKKFIKTIKENVYICSIFKSSCCTEWIPMNYREFCSLFTLMPSRRNFTGLTICRVLQMFKVLHRQKLTIRERISQNNSPAQTSIQSYMLLSDYTICPTHFETLQRGQS